MEVKGKCRFCEKEYKSSGLLRHLKSEMKNRIGGTFSHHFISVKGGPYFLYLIMSSDSDLEDLDDFLRTLWLECCGHLSKFMLPNQKPKSWDFEEQMKAEAEAKAKELKTVFSKGFSCRYIYDFGSSTELEIKVIDVLKLPKKLEDIVILSRNEEFDHRCFNCNKKADYFDLQRAYDDLDCFICKSCFEESGEEEGMIYGVANSPRMGVCGYDESVPPKRHQYQVLKW